MGSNPAASTRLQRSHRHQLIARDLSGGEIEEAVENVPELTATNGTEAETDLPAFGTEGRSDPVSNGKTPPFDNAAASLLSEYHSYEGIAGPDPRAVSTGVVADGLVRIIEVEGPMLAKQAYDIYLRGCNIRRLGGGLKSTMNKALMSAIRQGQVISKNDPGRTGLIFSTVRVKNSPDVKPRRRGSRTFEEIPPDQVRYIARQLLQWDHFEWCSDEHLRAILEAFDLKRLTTQVGTALLEILGKEDGPAGDLFPGSICGLPPKGTIPRSIDSV